MTAVTHIEMPHLAISYVNTVSAEPFDDFLAEVRNEKLTLKVEAREPDGPFSAGEWIVPSIVGVFIVKSYFDGFLKEIGKEHYLILKSALKKLTYRFIGPTVPRITLVAAGKHKISSPNPRFSLLYSISVVVERGLVFRLLLEPDMTEADASEAVERFLSFGAQLFDGTADVAAVSGLVGAKAYFGTVLFAFDRSSRALYVFNPRSGAGLSAAQET